jgi:hypothetical protein
MWDSMKFVGLLAITIAASVLISGCISAASLKSSECNGDCTDCDGSCKGKCDGLCGKNCSGEGANCTSECGGSGSGNCKKESECKNQTAKSNQIIVFQNSEVVVNGSTNYAAKTFDVKTPASDRIVMDVSGEMHVLGCSAVGVGEVIITLVDEGNNVVFRNVYISEYAESIELPISGGAYTLVVEVVGVGSYVVSYDVVVWAENPSEDGCGGCGGCPP